MMMLKLSVESLILRGGVIYIFYKYLESIQSKWLWSQWPTVGNVVGFFVKI